MLCSTVQKGLSHCEQGRLGSRLTTWNLLSLFGSHGSTKLFDEGNIWEMLRYHLTQKRVYHVVHVTSRWKLNGPTDRRSVYRLLRSWCIEQLFHERVQLQENGLQPRDRYQEPARWKPKSGAVIWCSVNQPSKPNTKKANYVLQSSSLRTESLGTS